MTVEGTPKKEGELSPEEERDILVIFYADEELRPLVGNDVLHEIVVTIGVLKQLKFISFINPDGTLEDLLFDEDDMTALPKRIVPGQLEVVRQEIMTMSTLARKVLEGDISPEANEVFSRPVWDQNNETLTPVETTFLGDWVDEHLEIEGASWYPVRQLVEGKKPVWSFKPV